MLKTCYFLLALILISNITGCGKPTPKNANDYLVRGMSRAADGDFQKAIDDYTKAIELEPENPELYIARAISYNLKEDFELALIDYGKAIQIKPEIEPGLHEIMSDLKEKIK